MGEIGKSAVGATEDVTAFLQMLGALCAALFEGAASAEIAAADVAGLSALSGSAGKQSRSWC